MHKITIPYLIYRYKCSAFFLQRDKCVHINVQITCSCTYCRWLFQYNGFLDSINNYIMQVDMNLSSCVKFVPCLPRWMPGLRLKSLEDKPIMSNYCQWKWHLLQFLLLEPLYTELPVSFKYCFLKNLYRK